MSDEHLEYRAKLHTVNRVIETVDHLVLIDEHGKVYERAGIKIVLSFQDMGHTLKVIAKRRED